jgi:geranylgeranyl transferase type-2 subunit beta
VTEASPYLLRLGARLTGLEASVLPMRQRHIDFLLRQQRPDGGFTGREGDSDLYYTSFAIRALRILDAFTGDPLDRVSRYLREIVSTKLPAIDLMNWLASALAVQLAGGPDLLAFAGEDFPARISEELERLRRPDGGYAKAQEGAAGSTYQSFLVLLALQLIGRVPPRPRSLVQFLYDRQRDDGGFVEIAPMRRSGTNPTAAAVAMLRELDALDDDIRRDVSEFFREVRSDEAGFQANTRVPFADSLSTFTAILTIQDLKLPAAYDAVAIRRWITGQLEFPSGGFRAATWDDTADVEYTFYSLGLLALLQNAEG